MSAVAMRITAAGHVRRVPATHENEALDETGREINAALGELRSMPHSAERPPSQLSWYIFATEHARAHWPGRAAKPERGQRGADRCPFSVSGPGAPCAALRSSVRRQTPACSAQRAVRVSAAETTSWRRWWSRSYSSTWRATVEGTFSSWAVILSGFMVS